MSFTNQWHITGLRLVCQTKPANYNGSFSCSDPMLTRIWYAGAYTVKLNLEANYFGAILIDRGDRISWAGDAHCAQAAALAAFGNDDFIKENIAITANNYNGIASYALYWVLSLIDYYNYTAMRRRWANISAPPNQFSITPMRSMEQIPVWHFTAGTSGWAPDLKTRTARRRRMPIKCSRSGHGQRLQRPWARMAGRIFRPNMAAMRTKRSPPYARILPGIKVLVCMRVRMQ